MKKAVFLVLALALAACQTTQARTTTVPSLSEGTVTAALDALSPLFQALERLESGRATTPVAIIQIGDSHSANDALSGRMRTLFQQRFGAAGRGMLPPGIPFKYYRPGLVAVSLEGGWDFQSSFQGGVRGPFSLTGFRLTGRQRGDVMSVASDESEGFDRAAVEILTQPGGGSFDVLADGTPVQRRSTASSGKVGTGRGGWIDLPVPPGTRRLEIRLVGDGPVSFLSWTTERNRPGVVYENQGIIGATVDIVGRWTPDLVRAALARRQPALLVIAYGTNEGFNDAVGAQRYAAAFGRHVRFLQTAAAQAPGRRPAVVVIGPPDANRLDKTCAPGKAPVCTPAGQDTCGWHPPPRLAVVRAVQKAVAAENGWFFWDWSAVMGGACGMHDWVRRNPPLALDDHVHLRAAGYHLTADALFGQLMTLYDRYKAQTGREK